MWIIKKLFTRRPKLMLNFYDPEYDIVMNLFKQATYLDQISKVLMDKSNNPDYVIGLITSFVQIYNSAGMKVIQTHKKKEYVFNMDPDALEKEVRRLGFDPTPIKDFPPVAKGLIVETHSLRREERFNRIVSSTYVKVLAHISKFTEYLKDAPDDLPKWCFDQYGSNLVALLSTINDSMKLYLKIGNWLKEDKQAIAKYKEGLTDRILEYTKDN